MSLILQKDENVAIVNKPFGMPAQPDPSGDTDLLSAVAKECSAKGKDVTVYPVQRIDRPVGGLCAVALTKKAAAELSKEVSIHEEYGKIYLCVTTGIPTSGEMTDYLFRDSKRGMARVGSSSDRDAKIASAFLEVLASVTVGKDVFSLCAVKLKTGRFHQIRVQLSHRGCPIFGDTKYGNHKKMQGIALFSTVISFTVGGKRYEAEAFPDRTLAPWSYFDTDFYEKIHSCRFEL